MVNRWLRYTGFRLVVEVYPEVPSWPTRIGLVKRCTTITYLVEVDDLAFDYSTTALAEDVPENAIIKCIDSTDLVWLESQSQEVIEEIEHSTLERCDI